MFERFTEIGSSRPQFVTPARDLRRGAPLRLADLDLT
jgi:hypothetical protein